MQRTIMQRIVLPLFTVFLLAYPALQRATFAQENKINPQAPEELKQFAFCIGEWEVRPQSVDDSAPPAAKMHGYYVLDGFAIQADYRGLDRNGKTVFRGTSFRTYDVANKQFSMKWMVANRSDYTLITGKMDREDLVSTGQGRDARGEFQERYRFYDIEQDNYKFKMERSYDGGKTWQVFALNKYQRVK